MEKYILAFCATLLAIDATSAAVKPEAGKYYLIEAARPNGEGRYLANTEVNSRSGLYRSDDITANNIWYVAEGSVAGIYTVQNYVTKGYLFEGEWGDTNVTKAETIDVYLPENTETTAENVYAVTPVNTDGYFLNCWIGNSGTTVYTNDDGSGWLFTPIDTEGQTVEEAIANAFFRVNGITYHVTSQQNKTVEVFTGDYSGSISIPETVSNGDTDYTVTALTDNAFRNCTDLTDIELPATVTSIGAAAFRNCSSLASVTILNPEPPTVGNNAFADADIQLAYVPAEAVEAYQAVNGWNDLYILDTASKSDGIVTKFTVDGINYHVTSLKDKTVEVSRGDYSGDIVIPETVTYNDTEYTVTGIGEEAFTWLDITSLKFPATISFINYVYGCGSLKNVEISESVTQISDWTFGGCPSLATITCLNPVPPTLGWEVFSDCPIIAVYVPSESVKAYQAADGWQNFYILDIASKSDELVTNFTVDGINYSVTSLKDNNVSIVAGDYSGDIVIPETITYNDVTYNVTSINSSAFENSSLTSIKLPSSITTIRDHAFKNCSSLTSIELPSSLRTIESWAFEACTSLKSIELPESLTTIEDGAFYNCTALTDINIPSQVTSISIRVFDSCSALSNLVIPMTMTSINEEAFANCTSLSSIISLNPTPPSLNESAFNECQIDVVYVPSDAVEAYQAANNWNNFNIVDVATSGEGIITNFTVDGINYRVTSLNGNNVSIVAGDYSGDIVIPATVTYDDKEFVVDKIGYEAFNGCSALTGITIPSTVTQIGSYAFCGTGISSITIPNTVNQIGWYAFNECPQLKNFTIEDGETALTIGDQLGNELWEGETIETLYVGRNIEFDGQYGAFDSNSNLKNVTFGKQVTNIYDLFFYNDTSLSKVISLNPVPPTLGNNVFKNCNSVAVYVPAEAIETYQSADGWKDFYIADIAAKDEELVTNFTVNGINYLVTSLKDKTVEVSRGDYDGDIVIPETITYDDTEYTIAKIAEEAFQWSGITSIEIPASVNTIGNNAFQGSNITTIEIPASVNTIGSWAFEYCRSLASITSLNPVPPTTGENTFNECPIVAVFVPADAIDTYQTADGWKEFFIADLATKPEELVTNFTVDGINYRLTSLQDNNVEIVSGNYSSDFVIPETVTYNDTEYTVTKIADRAFQWSSITSVEIPASVNTIGSWAFEYCNSLASITSLNPVPPTTGENTFYECPIIAVFVPTDAIDAYQSADGWKDFYIADITNKVEPNFTVDGINYRLTSLQDNNVEIVSGDYSGDFVIPETVTYNDTEYPVTKIADRAFQWSSITSVEIPASVTTIGNSAFCGSNITTIEIPASVNTIGSWAFEYCNSLASITSLNPVPPTTGENTFNECPIVAVFVPADAIDTYQTADGWKNFFIADIANKVDPNFTVDGINYRLISLQDNNVEILSGDYSGDFVIPEAVTYNDTEYTVTKIADGAFQWSGITSIIIPASVTTIGSWAFDYCNSLASITSLSPVPPTTGENTFNECPIVAVYVPADAIDTYQSADGWKDFYIADIANKVESNFTVDGINYHLISLQDNNVEIISGDYSGDFVIPEAVTYDDTEYTVTKISNSAFQQSGITSVEIPASVNTIGSWAFEYCSSLASITSLNSVPPTIGENTFNECQIDAVYVPADAIDDYQSADGWKDLYIVDIANKVDPNFTVDGINYHLISLQDNNVEVVSGNYSGDIVIPETVTYNDSEYTVTKISEYAFYDCSSLKSIDLPSSITSINEQAFKNCGALVSVSLSSSLTTIGNEAFKNCGSLAGIDLPSSLIYIGVGAFGTCTALTSMEIPSSVNKIDHFAFYDCSSLRTIEIPSSVTEIGSSVFWGCTALESIVIPSSLTKIHDGTFGYCQSLVSVDIPSSVTEIGDQAFAGCESLTSVNIPSSVTFIDYMAFRETALKNIVLPASINLISYGLFHDCTSLESIEIPASVTSIEDEAFYGCSSLTKVTSLNPVPPTLGGDVFDNSGLLAVYVPADAIDDYQTADGWKDFYIADIATKDEELATNFTVDGINYRIVSLQDNNVEVVYGDYSDDFVIPETVTYAGTEYTVTKIADGAFQGSNISTIEIPATVSSIGSYAFESCSSLASIVSLNPVPPTVDDSAFWWCDIEYVLVPADAVNAYNGADVWRDFFIKGLEPTSINDISADDNVDVVCYTLQGFRITKVRTMKDLKSLKTGVYIVNGKKILVK
jgi:hypothetical protein